MAPCDSPPASHGWVGDRDDNLRIQRIFDEGPPSRIVSETHHYPWRAIAQIEVDYRGAAQPLFGTAFFIGPSVLLTAGHNLLRPEGARAQAVRVVPARSGPRDAPAGILPAIGWGVHPKWQRSRSAAHDVAFIRVGSEPKINGRRLGYFGFPVMSGRDIRGTGSFTVTGFRAAAPQAALWTDSGPVRQQGPFLAHRIDTLTDTSGSPVYTIHPECWMHAIGVHVGHVHSENRAVWIDEPMHAQILGWRNG